MKHLFFPEIIYSQDVICHNLSNLKLCLHFIKFVPNPSLGFLFIQNVVNVGDLLYVNVTETWLFFCAADALVEFYKLVLEIKSLFLLFLFLYNLEEFV